ncbi:MarR family winged helix-turn-helix transcriptional regulator [Actinomadura algeriensis]|uniref:DNA-binding MarR family transcriptional regulator n=1 Tax=Actinomadura algeriensis TaxID=1679523 RepID=A0ABR9JZ23_9ACTN|nr:MarR family transcriptional regulator [Actinomadura algeriensis]MBE1535827.1 DNA-binding MarR family transcriptional regulator [Actinomadura algeriensis]
MHTDNMGFGDPSKPGPVEEWPVGRLFAATARQAGPMMWRLVEKHGVSPAGFFMLRILVGEDGLRPGEVAKRLMQSAATVTSVADTLQRNGLLERRRDERDRRAVRLHVTEAGRALVAETGHAMSKDLWALYDVPDEADEPAVRRYLLTLIDRFNDLSEGGRC